MKSDYDTSLLILSISWTSNIFEHGCLLIPVASSPYSTPNESQEAKSYDVIVFSKLDLHFPLFNAIPFIALKALGKGACLRGWASPCHIIRHMRMWKWSSYIHHTLCEGGGTGSFNKNTIYGHMWVEKWRSARETTPFQHAGHIWAYLGSNYILCERGKIWISSRYALPDIPSSCLV